MKKIFYNNGSILIDGEGCDVLFLDFIKNINIDRIINIKPKSIFILLPQIQEDIFLDIVNEIDNLINQYGDIIIPVVNDYGTLYYFSNKNSYLIGRILITQYMQSSSLNGIINDFNDINLKGFVLDNNLFEFTFKNTKSLGNFNSKLSYIYIGYNNYLSSSHECKFINNNKCNYECKSGINKFSLLLGKGNIIGKNLYLEKNDKDFHTNINFNYFFS